MASTTESVTQKIDAEELRHHTDGAVVEQSGARRVFIYDFPLRTWHWLNAFCIVILCITGYLIGKPLPSVPGEAAMNYSFGYVRMIHFATGQIMAIAFLFRIIWIFIGSRHAKEIFWLPITRRRWWRGVWNEIRWYLFIARRPRSYIGHNPLAQLAIFALCTLPMFHQVFTGFALYAEGQGVDTVWYTAFGWVFSLYGDSFFVHTMHRLVMWLIAIFCLIHMYTAIREDILSRQSIISTMVSGYRYFDEGVTPRDEER